MSAKTRRPDKLNTDALKARFGDHFAQLMEYITKGSRSKNMLDELLRAHQLVKENRLAVAIAMANATTIDPDTTLLLLSQRWSETTISPYAKKYLRSWGIEYVGETYVISRESNKASKVLPLVYGHLMSVGLPKSCDVLALGWRPPYWDDPAFNAMLDLPVGRVLRGFDDEDLYKKRRFYHCQYRIFARYHRDGEHYAGCVLRNVSDMSVARLSQKQSDLNKSTGIRAGMLCPPDWQAPVGVPQEWTMYQELMAQVQQELREQEEQRQRRLNDPEYKNDQLRRLKEKSVEELEISVRSERALRSAGISTVGQLVQKTEAEMLRLRIFDRRNLKEISDVLGEMGLTFGMPEEEPQSE